MFRSGFEREQTQRARSSEAREARPGKRQHAKHWSLRPTEQERGWMWWLMTWCVRLDGQGSQRLCRDCSFCHRGTAWKARNRSSYGRAERAGRRLVDGCWHLAAVARDAITGSSQHLSVNKEELRRKAEGPEHWRNNDIHLSLSIVWLLELGKGNRSAKGWKHLDRRGEGSEERYGEKTTRQGKAAWSRSNGRRKARHPFGFVDIGALGKRITAAWGGVTLILIRVSCIGISTNGLLLMERFKNRT